MPQVTQTEPHCAFEIFPFALFLYKPAIMSHLYGETAIRWQEQEDVDVAITEDTLHNLIVWNDDVNTFDHVITALIEICGHDPRQAEQCALIIHHQGKYAVKKGSFEYLRPKAEALIERGIQATID
jgi:ATP-dependent Clp protease adaptor protein ClpS